MSHRLYVGDLPQETTSEMPRGASAAFGTFGKARRELWQARVGAVLSIHPNRRHF
jgi:hypothetical protein